MRINIYTEELTQEAEIVTAEYVSSRTGQPMTNYGLRIYLKSAPELHYIPGRDDDRSVVTFWCGSSQRNVAEFINQLGESFGLYLNPLKNNPVVGGMSEAQAEGILAEMRGK